MVPNDKKNTCAPNHFQILKTSIFFVSSMAAPLALTDLLLANNLEANVVGEVEAMEICSFSFLSVHLTPVTLPFFSPHFLSLREKGAFLLSKANAVSFLLHLSSPMESFISKNVSNSSLYIHTDNFLF